LVRGGVSNATYKVAVLPERIGVKDQYDSLIDMWIEWYIAYLAADFPRLLIRFEDFLFHREHVMTQIELCATGETANLTKMLNYRISKAKNHGHSSDLVAAILKYGSSLGRLGGMTVEDIRYTGTALQKSSLLHQLGYRRGAL
jgi:hypothetical protein